MDKLLDVLLSLLKIKGVILMDFNGNLGFLSSSDSYDVLVDKDDISVSLIVIVED